MDNSKEITHDFEAQFKWNRKYWLDNSDLLNWIRFFYLSKELNFSEAKKVLEVGEGSGVIRKVMREYVEKYDTVDVNTALFPTFISDVREKINNIENSYDCVIAADILEHIPFDDVPKALENIHSYLTDEGFALITIPHRASHFLFMSPTNIPHAFRVPTGFLSPGAFYRRFIKRKIWIDPNHKWEIGDGYHTIDDVTRVMKNTGFKIEKIKKLIYVDFFVLKK